MNKCFQTIFPKQIYQMCLTHSICKTTMHHSILHRAAIFHRHFWVYNFVLSALKVQIHILSLNFKRSPNTECFENKEFASEFRFWNSRNLSTSRSPIGNIDSLKVFIGIHPLKVISHGTKKDILPTLMIVS